MTQKDTSGSWLKRWMEGWWAVGGKKGILWHHRLKLFISQRISFRFFNLNSIRGYVSDPSTPTVYDWLRVFFSKRFFSIWRSQWLYRITFVLVLSFVSISYFLCLVKNFITYCREILLVEQKHKTNKTCWHHPVKHFLSHLIYYSVPSFSSSQIFQ